MKIEEQVLSIDQMNHLKELGVEVKDTAMVRYRRRTDIYGNRVVGKWHFVPLSEIPLLKRFEKFEIHKTLTLQEILEMLPRKICHYNIMHYLTMRFDGVYNVSYMNIEEYHRYRTVLYSELAYSYIEAAYKMLCWVAENGYLNNKENENN